MRSFRRQRHQDHDASADLRFPFPGKDPSGGFCDDVGLRGSMGGSQVFLEEGETQSVETMIKCIAVASANDASVAMAEHIAGTESLFVDMMNQRAKELGMNRHPVCQLLRPGRGRASDLCLRYRADVPGAHHKISADTYLFDDLDGKHHPYHQAGDGGIRPDQYQ